MATSESDREMKNSENSAFSPLQTCLAMSSSQPYMNITQSPSTLFQSGGQSLSQGRLGSALDSIGRINRPRNNMVTELMEQQLLVCVRSPHRTAGPQSQLSHLYFPPRL